MHLVNMWKIKIIVGDIGTMEIKAKYGVPPCEKNKE